MIKRALGTAFVAAALMVSAAASQAADYRIDSAHSFVQPKSGSWVRAGLRKTLVDWGDERIERGPRGSPCG